MLGAKEHWKPEQKQFVQDNVGKLSNREIAKIIRKTEKAVEQFIHRNRIGPREKVVKNIVKEILTMKFKNPDYFHPNRSFYDAVLISQKRWWDLYMGRKQIQDSEYIRLVTHFDISAREAIEVKQLEIKFDNDGDSTGNN